MRFLSLFLVSYAVFSQQKVGKYEIVQRLPESGLYAGEEMQIEFRIVDTSKDDPLMGAAPVVRAQIKSVIDMPEMPGMPAVEEVAHPEGVPGDYGTHPLFAHGGKYRQRLSITPPNGQAFEVIFPLEVKDEKPAGARVSPYKLEVKGKPEDLTLRLIGPDGPVTEFDTVHERQMHLIAIRGDLQVFEHLHPEPGAGGVFRLKHKWPAGGEYTLFADTAPKGKGSLVVSAPLTAKGSQTPPKIENPIQASVDGPASAGRTKQMTVRFEPNLPLEPYLGAMGHLMAVTEDGKTLVHSHPVEGTATDNSLAFLVRLPKEGRYKAWLEVKSGGKVYTGPFEIVGAP